MAALGVIRILRRSQVPHGPEAAGQRLAVRRGRCEGLRFQALKDSEELHHRSQVGIILLRLVRRVPGQGLEVREELRRKRAGGACRGDPGGNGREPRAGGVEAARRQIQDAFAQDGQGPRWTAPAQSAKKAVEPAEVGAGQALPQCPVRYLRPLGGERRGGEVRNLLGGAGEELVVGAPPVQLLELRQGRRLALLLLLEAPFAAHGPTAASSASCSSSRSSSSAGSTSAGPASASARTS